LSINNTGDNNEESTKNTKEETTPNRTNKTEKKKISMDNFKRALESVSK